MTTHQDAFTPVVLSSPSTPELQIHVLPFGLTIHRILVGKSQDLIAGPEDPRDHEKNGRCFFGPLVGRFANRLPSGPISLEAYGGSTIDLPEWGGEGVCHHGGPAAASGHSGETAGTQNSQSGPFDRLVWKCLTAEEVTLFEAKDAMTANDKSQAVFAIVSPAGDNGFPGELLVEAKVSLNNTSTSTQSSVPELGSSAGTVRVEYRAKILAHSAPVAPLNLTHHWGFNLSASSDNDEKGTIDAHQLRLFTDGAAGKLKRLELDSRGVPTGGLVDCPDGDQQGHGWAVKGKAGFGKRVLDSLPSGGYDHFYTWGASNAQDKDDSTIRALLHSSSARLTLAFKTNQTGVQFYSANGQPPAPADPASSGGSRKLLHRRGNQQDTAGNPQRSAAFLEFGHPHATFLHKSLQDFVGGEDTILRDGQVYRNWVELEVWQQ